MVDGQVTSMDDHIPALILARGPSYKARSLGLGRRSQADFADTASTGLASEDLWAICMVISTALKPDVEDTRARD